MHYIPFEGQHYESGYNGNLKLLLIGDSHWGDTWDTNATNEVIERFIQGESFRFFAGIQRIVSGTWPKDVGDKQQFWSRVAFSNIIQEPMEASDTKPTKAQWQTAWEAFPDIVRATRPDLIFVFSKRAWGQEKYFDSPFSGKDVADLSPNGRPNEKAYLRDFGVIKSGYLCLSAALDHPSFVYRSGDWDLWHDWAQRLLTEAPEILAGK